MPFGAEVAQQVATSREMWLVTPGQFVAVPILAILVLALRPCNRLAAAALGLPIGCAGYAQIVAGLFSGFRLTGIVLVALALTMIALGLAAPRGRVAIANGWVRLAGAVILGFGLVYPYFVEYIASFADFDSLARLGSLAGVNVSLVRWPMMPAVVGLALLCDGFRSWTWSLIVGLGGLFFGVYCVTWPGMNLDVVGLLGSTFLLAVAVQRAVGRAAQHPREGA